MDRQKVIVVGAGIAGIASSIRFAVKGYDVSVFEANEKAGGKLGELHMLDFRFDTGPEPFYHAPICRGAIYPCRQKPQRLF